MNIIGLFVFEMRCTQKSDTYPYNHITTYPHSYIQTVAITLLAQIWKPISDRDCAKDANLIL